VKIGGDDYIVGPFPTSEQGKENRSRNIQEPALRKTGSEKKEENKEQVAD
jgi:hypothetical protein